MLLPSAFSCDQSQQPRRSTPFASPPASPPNSSHVQGAFIGNITSTCRSLQSMLSAMPSSDQLPPPPSQAQLPTPPMSYALPPTKFRLRSSRPRHDAPGASATPINVEEHLITRKKVVKRRAPPRGVNKRRRATDDDMGRDYDDEDAELQEEGGEDDAQSSTSSMRCAEFTFSMPSSVTTSFSSAAESQEPGRPSTPKRARIAPENLPLGLERSDFHEMHLRDVEANPERAKGNNDGSGTEVVKEADGELWSIEDDRVLVELVLEKLKLSKSELQDCARSLNRDHHSVGRRWKSLVAGGEIGVKRRRGKLHSTWR